MSCGDDDDDDHRAEGRKAGREVSMSGFRPARGRDWRLTGGGYEIDPRGGQWRAGGTEG